MKYLLMKLIQFYRSAISPRKPAMCRFIPTCSQYGLEAIERFGACKGGLLTVWRILRCNPWSAGGYDPVPEKKPKKGERGHGDQAQSVQLKSARSRRPHTQPGGRK